MIGWQSEGVPRSSFLPLTHSANGPLPRCIQHPLLCWHDSFRSSNGSIFKLNRPSSSSSFIMRSSSPKKSSITRRFTEMINQKTVRRPSPGDGLKEGSITPPFQTTTPSSSSSSPQSIQSRAMSSPQSTRYTFDEQHRLPV